MQGTAGRCAEHPGEPVDALVGRSRVARSARARASLEREPLDPAVDGRVAHGRDVEQRGAWEQGRVGFCIRVLPSQMRCWLVCARAALRAVSAATVSAAMWSSACAGSVITVMRSHSTDSGAIPMLRWIVGTPSSASRPDPLDAGSGVGPAAVGEDVDEPRAAGIGHLELVGDELDRVARERGAATGADAGDERQRPACRRRAARRCCRTVRSRSGRRSGAARR